MVRPNIFCRPHPYHNYRRRMHGHRGHKHLTSEGLSQADRKPRVGSPPPLSTLPLKLRHCRRHNCRGHAHINRPEPPERASTCSDNSASMSDNVRPFIVNTVRRCDDQKYSISKEDDEVAQYASFRPILEDPNELSIDFDKHMTVNPKPYQKMGEDDMNTPDAADSVP